MRHAKTRVPGGVRVHVPEAGILCVTFAGHADERVVAEACREVRRTLDGAKVKAVIFDTTEVTGFDATVRGPGLELLGLVKAAGVARGFAAAQSSGVRMIGSALGVAAGLRLAFYETFADAARAAAEQVAS
ncbi:MAG TPA: hypothetical protein VHB21_19635 [Minicystis sp.]|nr:hypothetical protein [Minicystis sp.]